AHDGRVGGDGFSLPFFLPGFVEVEEVDRDRRADVLHREVATGDLFDDAATVARRLDANAVVCALEGAVLDRDVAYAAADVAADRRAVPVLERAIGDEHVLKRLFLRIRFERDVVVANINRAMAYEYVATARRVNAVSVR